MMLQRSAKVPTREAMMRILVRCPRTARLFATGLETKATKFDGIRIADNKLACSFCGEVHLWTEENVVLARIPMRHEAKE